jgi:HSCB C-terminal oligomerisation domain
MALETAAPAAGACPSCGAERFSPVVCPGCGVIGKVEGDAYELLGMTRCWTVDQALVEERYAAITRLLEPKKEAAGPALEAVAAARRLLSDPMERGRHLLKVYGGTERMQPTQSPEFLTGVMEVREAYMDALESREKARLAAVRKEAEERLASALIAAGQSFIRLERAVQDELSAAAEALAVAAYWREIMDQMSGPKA